MTVIESIASGVATGRSEYEHIMAHSIDADLFEYAEKHVFESRAIESELALGDNVNYMKWLLDNGYAGKFRLIYIDPPFFTKAKYNATVNVRDASGTSRKIHHLAYDDRFERNLEFYVENMTVRLLMIKELLADDGLVWVHLDWHSSHYIKLILDELMGEKNFVNEIIWSYKSGGSAKKHFSRKHDSILVYSKTGNYFINVPEEKSYNRGFKPYNFKGVKEYQDENGWYTLVNMKDVWSIDMVGRTSKERTGYATQKPLELMKRIISSSSNEGDLVGDFFCGSGSFIEAAEQMGRRWVGCDNEELATAMAKKRLDLIEANYTYRSETKQPLRLGRVKLKKNMEEELQNGKKALSCAITAFDPDIEIGYIQFADRQYVKEALATNTLQFIDYVMIDPDYRDKFACEIVVEEGFDNMRFISPGNAAMVIVDVLGREYFVKLD
ncbi:MAG: site-specific DNA-methyltransferase [Clostridiales bacterium]|nr:site-specific DNA-methyltransferase [Candidatus Crickella equi]